MSISREENDKLPVNCNIQSFRHTQHQNMKETKANSIEQ